MELGDWCLELTTKPRHKTQPPDYSGLHDQKSFVFGWPGGGKGYSTIQVMTALPIIDPYTSTNAL